MTRIDEALQVLYGNSGRDLTAEGYAEHLHQLRKVNPTLARRIERTLEPFLTGHVFPGRKRKWDQTFEGVRARLALLPNNPHVRQDVILIRSVLGIPNNHVKATKNDTSWKEISALVQPQSIRRVLESNMAGEWHYIHCQAVLHNTINPTDSGILPSPFVKSAISSSRVNFKASTIPSWLQKPPSGPAPYDSNSAPVDWAAGRLVERHRLPWQAALPLVFYIITQNASFLKKIESLDIAIKYGNAPSDNEAFTVVINNLDEFVSKKDWNRVWDRMIKPRQSRIWETRGTKPQGRRSVDISRLNEALPWYCKVVEEQKTIPDILADPSTGNLDQETIRRVLSDLSKLLKPIP